MTNEENLENRVEAVAKLHRDSLEAAAKDPFTAYARERIDYYLNSDKYKLKHHCETCFAQPDKTVHRWKGGRIIKVPKRYTFGWFTNSYFTEGRYYPKLHRITLNVDLLDGPRAEMQNTLMHEIAHALTEQWHHPQDRLIKERGRWRRTIDSHDARWRDIAKELGDADVSEYEGVRA